MTETPPGSADPSPARGLRVLLVDDRPDNLLALEAVLEPLGVEMATAPSGEEALRLLLDEEFAVIVLDVQMPGLDGFETARLIKGREKTRHIPIIFLTAISGALEHHLEGYASGAIDYVYKPFEPEILRAKVSALAELVNTKERLEREIAKRRESEAREEALRQQRDIARHLQQSLLPERLPELPGIRCSARYLPGSAGLEVGGDWYDVLPVAGGEIAVAIGDVVGRGLRAAVTMGQLRTGLRAYALEDPSPSKVVPRLDRLAQNLSEANLATLTYAVYSPESGTLRFMCAGHSPLLVVSPDGSATFVEGGRCAPLGVCVLGAQEGVVALEPGCLLVLHTDGLVERPGQTLDEGLALLASVAGDGTGKTPDELCDSIMAAMVGASQPKDDVALLVVSLGAQQTDQFRFAGLTEGRQLAAVRRALAHWLKHIGATAGESDDIVLAASEAMSNALMHAYGSGEGVVEIEAGMEGDEVVVTVTDTGVWRSRATSGGGRGITLMQALVGSVHVDSDASGTRVRLQRRLGHPLGPPGTVELPWLGDEEPAGGDTADLVAIVTLAENVDLSNAEQTGSALARAIASEQLGLVLDLTTITYLDSSGIRMLWELKRRLERRRQRLWVVVPPGSPVQRLLELAPAGTLVPVAGSVEEALSAIQDADVDALFQ